MSAGNWWLETSFPSELQPGEEDLFPLAQVAVCTPLIDAQFTLNVLADILVERGIVKVHAREEIVAHPGETHMTWANPPTPLEAALSWARAKVGLSTIERIKRAIELTRDKSFPVDMTDLPEWRSDWAYDPRAMPRDRRPKLGATPLKLRANLKRWER